MAGLMRILLTGALALALAACGKPADVAGTEDATVKTAEAGVAPAANLDPRAAAEIAKAKDLSDKLAAEKPAFDAVADDPVQLEALAEAGNGWALFHRAQNRLASQDYMAQQGGFTDMELAAEKGVSGAQLWVGQHMAFGKDGYKLQPSSGLKMMERAAAQGNVEAIMAVAGMYVQDVYMHDNKKAREWYERAAKLGSADAKRALEGLDAAVPPPE
jgi:TPR repeat protein